MLFQALRGSAVHPSEQTAAVRRPSRVARRLLAGAALAPMQVGGALAQPSPAPTDEAALYEAAKKEGKLVWYVGGPLDGMNAIAAEFEKDFPGVKVETMRLVGVQQYQRFMDETSARKHLADVLQNTDYPSMLSLVDEGHIVQWKIPTFDRVPEMYRIKDFAYAQYTSTNAIVYNEKKLSPEEIKLLETGWEAVLDPRFKERFSVSPMKCGSATRRRRRAPPSSRWGWPARSAISTGAGPMTGVRTFPA